MQVQGTERIYFKSFRDPRVISRRTGQPFADVEALLKVDPADGPATEIIHFAIHSPRSPYGKLSDASVPRIERFIEENLKGKANFHKILILEAEGGRWR